jgi:hypothetical protein
MLAAATSEVDRAACCSYPSLPAHARTIEQFIPAGWSIETQSGGALEEGHHEAVALLLRPSKTGAADATLPRILAVVETASDGTYDLVLQNHTLIPRLSDELADKIDYDLKGGPQLQGGSLRITVNRSIMVGPTAEADRTFIFRRISDRFVLIGYDERFVTYRLETGGVSINYLTNKFSRTTGENCAGRKDVVKRCRFNTTWHELKPAPLLSIEQVDDGFAFDPKL